MIDCRLIPQYHNSFFAHQEIMRYEMTMNGHCVDGVREKIVGINCSVGVVLRTLKMNQAIYKMNEIAKETSNYINLTGDEYVDEIVSRNNCDAIIELATETFTISCSVILGIDKQGRTTFSASIQIDLQFLVQTGKNRVFELCPCVKVDCSTTHRNICAIRCEKEQFCERSMSNTCIVFDIVKIRKGIELIDCSRIMIPDEGLVVDLNYYGGSNQLSNPWRYAQGNKVAVYRGIVIYPEEQDSSDEDDNTWEDYDSDEGTIVDDDAAAAAEAAAEQPPTNVPAEAEAEQPPTNVPAEAEAEQPPTNVPAEAEAEQPPTNVPAQAEAEQPPTNVPAQAEAEAKAEAEAEQPPTNVPAQTQAEAEAEAEQPPTTVPAEAEAEAEAEADAEQPPTNGLAEAEAEADVEPPNNGLAEAEAEADAEQPPTNGLAEAEAEAEADAEEYVSKKARF